MTAMTSRPRFPHPDADVSEVPVYGALPATTAPASYTSFVPAHHHADHSIERKLSSAFEEHAQTAIEHHDANHGDRNVANTHAHAHTQNSNLHLDPHLSEPLPNQHFARSSSPISHNGMHSISALLHPHTPHAPQAPVPASPPPQIPNAAPPGEFDMLPPPASQHPSWNALHDFAQSHASEHGYALSINTTAKNRSRIKLACVCYGAPKNTHKLTPETRIRKNRVSYKTGCKMWVEGKRQEDGTWLLKVGEPMHNHPGRSVEGWATQRKRTWGIQGGRIGMGGVTAKEEKARLQHEQDVMAQLDSTAHRHGEQPQDSSHPASHSLESGGLVWQIVEQEMLKKGGPGQGRDRGVGRTVKVLQEQLPGIQIFKRDVYNIRAQIKRARKDAGQKLGEGLNGDEDGDDIEHQREHTDANEQARDFAEIDPALVAHALRHVNQQHQEPPTQEQLPVEVTEQGHQSVSLLSVQQPTEQQPAATEPEPEVDKLRREMESLRQALEQRTREAEEKDSENQRLKMELEVAKLGPPYTNGQTTAP